VPAAFAPFGHVIGSLAERDPDAVMGGLYPGVTNPVRAEIGGEPFDGPGWYEQNKDRVPLSEGLQRAHFAYHTDSGQSFFSSHHRPTVYLLGPVQDPLAAEDVRAFYTDGSLGLCLHVKVWHTQPICLEGEDVYQTMRGEHGANNFVNYHDHTVEMNFDLEQGLAIEPDMENFKI
jgi:hypothetical protein